MLTNRSRVRFSEVPPTRRTSERYRPSATIHAGDRDEEWHTMVLVALRTGMRMSELIALRWQDVDLVAGKITVRQNAVKADLTLQ